MTTLKEVGIVKEVDYSRLLSNVMLVTKTCGSTWMCVAFTNVNDACPKDCYPLPSIDLLVDATATFGPISSLDAYLVSSY